MGVTEPCHTVAKRRGSSGGTLNNRRRSTKRRGSSFLKRESVRPVIDSRRSSCSGMRRGPNQVLLKRESVRLAIESRRSSRRANARSVKSAVTLNGRRLTTVSQAQALTDNVDMELSVLIKNIKLSPGTQIPETNDCFIGVYIREPDNEQVCRTDDTIIPGDRQVILSEQFHFKVRSLDSTIMILLLSRNPDNPEVPILVDKIKLSVRKIDKKKNGRHPIFYLENGTFANIILTAKRAHRTFVL